MNISIKKFDELTTKELYNILKLREEVFIIEQDCPYADCDNKDFNSYHLQLELDGILAGYLRIIPPGVSYLESSFGRVVVKKEFRKHKFGETIVGEAINFLENELGETQVRISAQYYLVEFYKKFGFDTVGDIYLEDYIDHIQMYYKKKRKA